MSRDSALAVLSENEIIRYYDDISELDLPTLEMRNRPAFEAIKRPDGRRVLIADGLWKVSRRKTGELEIEVDESFDSYSPDPRPEHRELARKLERLRQMLQDGSRHKFDIATADKNLILGRTPIGKLFYALDELLLGINGDPNWPAWQTINYNYIRMAGKTESAFKSIFYILEENLKPNRVFLMQFIESNRL